MTKQKNHNSILVLATLGVYLGLVLVGATPQVLAQAAMTRQFDIRDEIEFKEDLDNKPEPSAGESDEQSAVRSDRNIAASVHKFLSQFRTGKTDAALFEQTAPSFDYVAARSETQTDPSSEHFAPSGHFGRILTITCLPRAGLDPAA